MKTSSAGIELLKKFEGCKLRAYQDRAGVWTVGYGHTAAAGWIIPERGMVISQEMADEQLTRDLGQYEAAVDRAVSRFMSQNQFDAMVSLCFNIGPTAFAKSSVVRHFNAGANAKAAVSFLLWNKAKNPKTGKLEVSKGLANRRAAEMKLFLTPTEAATAPIPIPSAATFNVDYVGPVPISGGPGAYPFSAPMAVYSPPGAVPAQPKGTTMLSGYKTYIAAFLLGISGIVENFLGIDIPGVTVDANWMTMLIAAIGLGSLRSALPK